MHVGVKIGPIDGPQLGERARKAEALGLDSVWLSERVVVPLDEPHPYDPMGDPWIGLTYVAAVTERVQLGTSVAQIALRYPVQIARILATLDVLSEGRLIVGGGAGWVKAEFAATGVDFATRGGRLGEMARVLRHLWTTPEEPWEGKHFQLPGVKIYAPKTSGGPPIFLGAGTSAGLRRVARYADGLLALPGEPEALAAVRQSLDEKTREAGRDRLPIYAQAVPPQTAEAGEKLVDDLAGAGVDGIIFADPLDKGGSFPPDEVVRAIVAKGQG